jgi:serine/threonine-protein kinase
MLFFESETSGSAPSPRYETLARIGRGGMAEVLLAATRANGVVKLSVLKCLWPELAEDAEFVEMFLDEARLSARLAHPNVVQTHEVVQHEGRLALAMEYLDGQPLTSILGRLGGARALPLPTRLRIVTSVLAGLDYAHGLLDFDGEPLAVVHRDVSPHNVIVTYEGHIKLIDFGVAKTLAASHQTRPGGFKGKLAYLAPEAVRGEGVDRRTDIFSVGVMLWEILAGRRMWAGKSEGVSGAWRLAAGEPAPSLPADLDIPRALRVITTRALALDPAARFQTAAELAAALEAVGADASDSHARRLGAAVAEAFSAERAQRRALIEFHLRPASTGAHDATVDYESFEVSAAHAAPSGRSRPRSIPPSEITPTAFPPAGPNETVVTRGGLRRPFLAAAVAASVALAGGVYLGRLVGAGTAPSTAARAAALTALPVVPLAAPPPAGAAATAIVEPIGETRDGHAAAPERHEHRSRRARALDLAADDVLGLDGQPVAATGGAAPRSRHD